jgi:hypothetical protein
MKAFGTLLQERAPFAGYNSAMAANQRRRKHAAAILTPKG